MELADHPFNIKEVVKGTTGFIHGIDIRNPEHLIFEQPLQGLRYEIMGGVNLKQLDRLRATLKVTRLPQLTPLHAYRNTLDLYSDVQVQRYIRESAQKLELGTTELTNTIYSLIEGVEKYRLEKRQQQVVSQETPRVELNPQEKTRAKKLLSNSDLMNEITKLLAAAGLVEEQDKGLLLFCIFVTRYFDFPLHAIVYGSSGSGKTNLLKTVVGCVPDESRHITTALTENVLFYPPYKDFWKHKILLLEDLDGSISALLPLREFMSNQHIVKFSTEMDTQSGEHRQRRLEAKGPVCFVGATTKERVYEDNANRSYAIHVDESYQHQQAVMDYQNRKAAGLLDKVAADAARNTLQNCQRLLEPLEVRNPFQPELMLPAVVFKPLRTNEHYINLIKAVTFLHQYQLEVKKDLSGRYIETKLDHIEWANRLCRESLLRKSDQLTGQQRTFFERLKKYLKKKDKESFYTKDLCKDFRLFRSQVSRQLAALENADLITRIGSNPKMSFEYTVNAWDDYEQIQSGIDILDQKLEELRQKYPDA